MSKKKRSRKKKEASKSGAAKAEHRRGGGTSSLAATPPRARTSEDVSAPSKPNGLLPLVLGLCAAAIGVATCFWMFKTTETKEVGDPPGSVAQTAVAPTVKSPTPTVPTETVHAASGSKQASQAPKQAPRNAAPIQLPTAPGLEKQRFDSVVRTVAEREDPVIDGWDSERFNEVVSKQLKTVGKFLSTGSMPPSEVTKLVADDFQSRGLRPGELSKAYGDDAITVSRGETTQQAIVEGLDGFEEVMLDQHQALSGLAKHHFKFKVIRVEQAEEHTKTIAYFQIDGHSSSSAKQVNATWTCRWIAGADPDHPLLAEIEVDDYEEVVYASKPMFADCTESVFRDSDRFGRQLIYGIDHWTDQFDSAIARPAAGHGIAIGDVNGDGLDDVYLCQSPALPNLLLIQNADGTVRDTAVEAGVNWLEGTRAALLADLDNDGDQDLVAVLGSKVVVHSNDGTGNFKKATIVSTPSSLFQINAVDYDNDSDLDLFICGYTLSSGIDVNDVFANPMPFHDANNGAPNVMLRNDGGWGFTDVTNEIGLGENNRRFSYASAWDDYDADGDLDLYIANDFGRNNLYRNDDGKFSDVAPELEVEDIGPGMSASWGDYNNDGRPDIYVSNMFSSAGNRITHQLQFKTGLDSETKKDFQRHARGNSLFENAGDGKFHDRSVDLGVTLGRWAWGSLFVDLNNDGWEDLYVANGFVTADSNNDL